MQIRSVTRDAKAISLGLPSVQAEIIYWEKIRKKTRSVKQRLERLYAARNHLIESPEDSKSLVEQLKGIQNESA